MTHPNTSLRLRGRRLRKLAGAFCVASALVAGACVAPPPAAPTTAHSGTPSPSADPGESHTSSYGPPDAPKGAHPDKPLFADWPKDQKPDAVIVFSGQTFGYLQPCGCSRPQTGGLERRFMLVESLKEKGWPVVGVDLGSAHAEKAALERQGALKYAATMAALREMGYAAVGVGRTELKHDVYKLIAEYWLQKEQPPFLLAGNVVGVAEGKAIPREQYFPVPPGAKRALVESVEVTRVGGVTVGVAGVAGKAVQEENRKEKWDATLDFTDARKALEDAAKALAANPGKPQLNVLIFQGPAADAAKAAADFPQFQVILCQSETDLPPLQPTQPAGTKTQIVQVGHRGQHVGVLGAFKKPDGTFDFKYQLVVLGEQFITPGSEEEAHKRNKVLPVLEEYARKVKAANLLAKYPRVPHPAQIQAQSLKAPVKLAYAGTDACKACHAAEYDKWKQHPHHHAMETLEKHAKRPGLRNFDGECVQCHSVGFHYQGGYVDESKTPNLKDVGCESCHGPGSGHVAAPRNKELLALLSPWKQPGADKLPDAAFMKKVADAPPLERGQVEAALTPTQRLLVNGVGSTCMKCHDHESDPHFDLYKSWPKVDHSGLAPKGGWPAVPPGK